MLESLIADITDFFPKRDKKCLKNILLLCLSILDKETVNLNRVKNAIGKFMPGSTFSVDSHYKRLIRVFDNYSFSSLWIEIVCYGVNLLRLKSESLILDGTSWRSGGRWFHYLTFCVVYKQVAIPIFWLDLSKHGNSNFKERRKLIAKSTKYFDLKGKTLLADREYIGRDWFKLLIDKGLNFVIRSKINTYKSEINAGPGKSFDELIIRYCVAKFPIKRLGRSSCSMGWSCFLSLPKTLIPSPRKPTFCLSRTWIGPQ